MVVWKKGNSLFGPNSKKAECLICRRAGLPGKFHRHHSTVEARNTLKAMRKSSYKCPSCKIWHSSEITTKRLRVIVSSSTLHNVHLIDEYKADHHYDLLTICAGTIKMARINFQHSYNNSKIGLDIAVAVGLNDVRKRNPVAFRIEMHKWHKWINAQEIKHGVKHTLAFIEMLRPPMFVWFPSDGEAPPDHQDYAIEVDDLNEEIRYINQLYAKCRNPISFRNDGRRGLSNSREQHMWSRWREDTKADMLHIADKNRPSMVKRIEKYFELNT